MIFFSSRFLIGGGYDLDSIESQNSQTEIYHLLLILWHQQMGSLSVQLKRLSMKTSPPIVNTLSQKVCRAQDIGLGGSLYFFLFCPIWVLFSPQGTSSIAGCKYTLSLLTSLGCVRDLQWIYKVHTPGKMLGFCGVKK